MTTYEKEKCRKLLEEAIQVCNRANEEYMEYERLIKEDDKVNAEVKLRQADYKLGYANGIHQVLAVLRFQNDMMKELERLL